MRCTFTVDLAAPGLLSHARCSVYTCLNLSSMILNKKGLVDSSPAANCVPSPTHLIYFLTQAPGTHTPPASSFPSHAVRTALPPYSPLCSTPMYLMPCLYVQTSMSLLSWCLYCPGTTPIRSSQSGTIHARSLRLRPTRPARFPAERTPFGGLTVTVNRNHS